MEGLQVESLAAEIMQERERRAAGARLRRTAARSRRNRTGRAAPGLASLWRARD